jgi:hypothetical protein
MNIIFSVILVLLLSACGIVSPNFSLDPGMDGCVHIQLENFSGGPVHADKLTYHRVNEKCKDIPIHPASSGS